MHEADPMFGALRGTKATAANRRYLTRLTVISTLGGLLFGYDTGVISGALLFIGKDLHLSLTEQTFVVTSLLFGAIVGAQLGGRLADAIGRRTSMRIYAVVFFLGAIGSGFSPTLSLIYASRVVLGLAVGAASVTVPVYLSEMAPAYRRGRMTTINELMIVSGQFIAFGINELINSLSDSQSVWRIMLSVAAIPAVALFIGMFFLPDSPRWYAIKGRLDDARRVLEMSRTPAEAAEEFNIVKAAAQRDLKEERGAARRHLAAFPWMRRILYIGIGLALAQQLTGINTAEYYAPTILKSTGLGTSASLISTIFVGAIGVVGTVLGIYLLGVANRRPLLFIGFSGVAASDVLLAIMFQLPVSTTRSYLILVFIMLFVFFVQTFIGTLIWLMLSEIFPMIIRGYCMGIAVFFLWGINTTISYVFPFLIRNLGSSGTFTVFAAINVCSLLFVIRFAPETRGRTLEKLEEEFRSRDASDLTRQAPEGVSGS